MKRILLIPIALVITFNLSGQEGLTLGECYTGAVSIHPLAKEKEYLQSLWELRDQNLKSSLYPSLEAGASVLYNSNVVDLGNALSSLPVPGIADAIGGMPHDQYRLTVDINQLIWDGGMVKSSRDVESAALRVSEQDVEVELYKTRERINDLFFSLALLKKKEELLESWLEVMKSREMIAVSAIENGIMLPSERDIINGELLDLRQQIEETSINISSLAKMLADITGLDINHSTSIILPEPAIPRQSSLNRPELEAIDLRINQAEAGRSVLRSSRMPKAFGFATLGYGSPPGNNFFSDSFDTYAVVGAGIKWNIFDWNNSRRKGEMIDLNKQILSGRKSEIEDKLERALFAKEAEIQSIESLIESGEELVKIRQSISAASNSKFRNGTITSTEYITILNQEKEALLKNSINRITLVKLQVEYMNILGNDVK